MPEYEVGYVDALRDTRQEIDERVEYLSELELAWLARYELRALDRCLAGWESDAPERPSNGDKPPAVVPTVAGAPRAEPVLMPQELMPHVDIGDGGCWLWKGKYQHGTAIINLNSAQTERWAGRSTVTARRFAIYETGHMLPPRNVKVLPKQCGNQQCVHPEHTNIVLTKRNGDEPPARYGKDTGERLPTGDATVSVQVSMQRWLLERIDKKRGSMNRSAYVRSLIMAAID